MRKRTVWREYNFLREYYGYLRLEKHILFVTLWQLDVIYQGRGLVFYAKSVDWGHGVSKWGWMDFILDILIMGWGEGDLSVNDVSRIS